MYPLALTASIVGVFKLFGIEPKVGTNIFIVKPSGNLKIKRQKDAYIGITQCLTLINGQVVSASMNAEIKGIRIGEVLLALLVSSGELLPRSFNFVTGDLS